MNLANGDKGKGLVSICIPSYNGAKYIRETIESVLDSAYTHLEIIVNDDASTDNTEEIVKSFHDERIFFFRNESNVGVPKNWNRALKKASGEFVGLLNHDDLYDPFWLSFAVHVLKKYPHIGWVATAFRVVNENGKTLEVVSRFPETQKCSREEVFSCVAKLDGFGPGYIARHKVLEEVGYYDENAGPSADNDLFLRLASRYPLYYSSYPHADWRIHAGNLTHRWGIVDQTSEGLRMLHKVFDGNTLPEKLQKCERRSYSYFYLKVINNASKLLNAGDFETIHKMFHLLQTEGYKCDEPSGN